MGSRQLTKNKKSQGETLAPASGMFEGRSFPVQGKVGGKVKKPDMKTSLMRAERYGHHLDRIHPAGLTGATALQPKYGIGKGKSGKSDRAECPQVSQAKRLNPVFTGQTMDSTLSSQPIQLVYDKEKRQIAKDFNRIKKEEIKKIEEQNKEPTTYKSFKKKKKHGDQSNNNNSATNKFKKDHVKENGITMANASNNVANKRIWGKDKISGEDKTSGKSTVVSISKPEMQKEQRFAVEERKLKETKFEETGKIDPKMGVNKPTKFAYEHQTSDVISDKQGNRKVTTGKTMLGHPVVGINGSQIHHLHGTEGNQTMKKKNQNGKSRRGKRR